MSITRTEDVRLPELSRDASETDRRMLQALYDQFRDTNQRLWALESTLGIAPRKASTTILSGATYAATSGVLTGGAISIGTGGAGVATAFTVAAGTGQIVDNTVNPTTVTAVSWTAKTDVAVTNIATALVTYVAIDSAGAVVQSTTDFTPAQMRDYVVIGVAVHSNQTTVNAVNQTQIVAYNTGNQLNDLFYSLGLFNVSGNTFSANGANLKLNKSTGQLFRRGANYTTLTDNPHVITTGALTQAPLRMQNRTGAGSASGTDVDVANYDLAGVTTAISPSTRFTILRVFLFQSNLVAVQRGQATYLSLAEAKAAIQTEAYTTNSILSANGLLRGFIVAQANATSLSDASKVFMIEAGKFGGTSGVGGLSVSTMQNAYDNSSAPEILTDSTRGAVTIKRGSAADTDAVLEAMNNAGSVTAAITGAGALTGTALTLTEAVGASALTLTGATQTTSQPVLNAAQTWNAGAVAFTAVKVNVTSSASSALSKLLDLQVGGTPVFSVYKSGLVGAANALQITGDLTVGGGAGARMVISSAVFDNGAAAAAGTLNNAPVAGDPTKWIPINDGGTLRYLPAW